jgi:uncharacterized protein (DUF1800 family)
MIDKAAALHLANRLGLGPAPGQVEQISAAGLEPWLDSQLNPRTAELPQNVTGVLRDLPSFGKNSSQLYAEYWWNAQLPDPKAIPKEEKRKLRRRERQVLRETQIARLARAVGSPWQLQEALVEFWFNHFNVYEKKGTDKIWIGAYEEEAIRPHTLGRFSDLLLATARHPAMLVYLDNARNVAPETAQDGGTMAGSALPRNTKKERGINENYAREVMELHTLGVDGGYTQADVISLAHILTGWTVGAGGDAQSNAAINSYKNRGAFRFAARRHDASPEKLLGRTFSGDNENEGVAALLMLAAHPSTAHHISFQLAQYFVADNPPVSLVDNMTTTFRQTDGDIRSVLKTMTTHPQFLAPANFGVKFKTPYRFVVSAARAAGTEPSLIQPLVAVLEDLGQPLYGCISPDGYGCTEATWLDPNGLLRRTSFAMRMGAGEFGTIAAGDFAPLDAARLEETLEPALSKRTLAAIAETAREHRAGAILGSPDFMRC